MKLFIAGDTVLNFASEFKDDDNGLNLIVGEELADAIEDCDLSILNLEGPIYDGTYRIDKCGPHVVSSLQSAKILKYFPRLLVCLSNNHIFDCGIDGLKSTIGFLDDNCISHIGAGFNENDRRRPFLIENICILNYCEHEFSFDSCLGAGANEFDDGLPYHDISEYSKKGYRVIVIYHGGKEYISLPSKKLMARCHLMAEFGADLIVCEHSHILGAHETFKGTEIFYGIGNFLFHEKKEPASWKNGAALIVETNSSGFSVKPIFFAEKSNGKIRQSGKDQSIEIADFLEKDPNEYSKHVKKNIYKYLSKLRGYGRIRMGVEVIIFRGFFLRRIYTKKKLLAIKDIILCESHNELLISGIDFLLKQKEEENA